MYKQICDTQYNNMLCKYRLLIYLQFLTGPLPAFIMALYLYDVFSSLHINLDTKPPTPLMH
jgi:hypothetical protein